MKETAVEPWVDLTIVKSERVPFSGTEVPCCSVDGNVVRVFHLLRNNKDDGVEFDWLSTYLTCPKCGKSYDRLDNFLVETRVVDGELE